MAALLRHGAARRLGGSVLQRTKAAVTSPAVAEGRRRLVPRRMLTTGKIQSVEAQSVDAQSVVVELSPEMQRAKVMADIQQKKLSPEMQRAEVMADIQQKKEEAYDALALVERMFSTASFGNKLLVQHLAVQIEPRRKDWQWRRMYWSRKALTVLETVGLISLAGVVSTGVVRYIRKGSEDKTRLAKN